MRISDGYVPHMYAYPSAWRKLFLL